MFLLCPFYGGCIRRRLVWTWDGQVSQNAFRSLLFGFFIKYQRQRQPASNPLWCLFLSFCLSNFLSSHSIIHQCPQQPQQPSIQPFSRHWLFICRLQILKKYKEAGLCFISYCIMMYYIIFRFIVNIHYSEARHETSWDGDVIKSAAVPTAEWPNCGLLSSGVWTPESNLSRPNYQVRKSELGVLGIEKGLSVLFQIQYSVVHLTEITISCAAASPAKHTWIH